MVPHYFPQASAAQNDFEGSTCDGSSRILLRHFLQSKDFFFLNFLQPSTVAALRQLAGETLYVSYGRRRETGAEILPSMFSILPCFHRQAVPRNNVAL